ncbi:type I restriction-modification system subunit M [Listeria swaminathanii]|uniref:site-specific DNA-methyltransferase (adenine-specific) n=1 Tax=Listeria swaminathanii TaxID=2713501 RepID=A0ABU2IEG2_9LIST|nr:type I restriction-modification system subunit M [Listeria swaminathanii]MDT0015642.1 type I restriction-modification system subunit M [Listeria swaminathanii]MDT0021079.1 type I restriction-modification system subunit M [Listeria swaminathanii]MDT0032042.1 type I restriction-modification system subunit M [Listeria swaminathanii]MDT0052108.1 type I restriction-modification system subunit M [Listeria swaminathanii]MDT0054873.1 type I restriction-modification system subunit M [Listeria swamin
MITSEEIKRRLWDGANELRGSMDASRYKDYMLGLMFYKFLSDKTLEKYKSMADKGQLSEAELVEEYAKDRAYHGENLDKMIQSVLGYFVLPEHLYQTWLKDIAIGEFEVQKVIDSLNNFERTIAVSGDSDDFQGLFSSSTIDLTDTALGSNLNERSKNIKALIELFQDLNMVALQKSDVLGDAYEYLIGQFAMESGKKAGEFYTPRQVSEVMAQIAAKTSNITSIYDPTVGSGSLLLTVKKHLKEDVQRDLNYYGQEKNTATYNLTRMNLLLHDVRPEKMSVKNGDTLSEDWPEDPSRPAEGVLFDAVVMNPPYSLANWNKSNLKVSDPRFEIAGVLPPDSKGDFAFLLHGLYHLGQTGTMAIVLPHGVLFRGGTEGEIRKRLLNKNYIDTIIGLPGNLFTNTGIPVCVLILKKNRAISDPVLVIDASRNFIKVGKQNELQEKDIARIVDTYVERAEKAGYSHLASREEIVENDYNMNIPRYVESIDEEIPHDVDAHLYGGIPQANIDELKTLQTTVKNVLDNALKPIRDGYVQLEKPMDELTNEVLTDKNITTKSDIIREKSEAFIELYWKKLHEINNIVDVNSLMEEMLVKIKELLSSFDGLDVYDGYQIIAEVWKNSLTHDAELIAGGGFYTIGRTREPNMVTKGSGNKKREEQDGWVGAIVPNELIAKRLYSEELQIIEDKKARLTAVEAELSELVEAAKVEDSEENIALFESIKKNAEGEPQSSFESKTVKAELKKITKDSPSYDLLKKVDGLITEKSSLGKKIKAKESELKEALYERILVLTDEEIDELVFEKWFGTTVYDIVKLIELPLKKELDILEQLHERYAETLDDIDEESKKLEKELEKLMSELVVR